MEYLKDAPAMVLIVIVVLAFMKLIDRILDHNKARRNGNGNGSVNRQKEVLDDAVMMTRRLNDMTLIDAIQKQTAAIHEVALGQQKIDASLQSIKGTIGRMENSWTQREDILRKHPRTR